MTTGRTARGALLVVTLLAVTTIALSSLTVFDFWRLRRAGNGDVALIALSIFLDALNIFLFMLQLLGGNRS